MIRLTLSWTWCCQETSPESTRAAQAGSLDHLVGATPIPSHTDDAADSAWRDVVCVAGPSRRAQVTAPVVQAVAVYMINLSAPQSNLCM
jgi:hypothetical protein